MLRDLNDQRRIVFIMYRKNIRPSVIQQPFTLRIDKHSYTVVAV